MNRVKVIRSLMQLSRNAMHELYNIPASSIERWENGQNPSRKSCEKIAIAANAHGIKVSANWIFGLEAQEPEPIKSDNIPLELAQIKKKISKTNSNIIVFKVVDNSMAPNYETGDWVICKRLSTANFAQSLNTISLVDCEHGRNLRLIKTSNCPGLFDLIAINHDDNGRSFYEVKTNSIALVIFHLKS